MVVVAVEDNRFDGMLNERFGSGNCQFCQSSESKIGRKEFADGLRSQDPGRFCRQPVRLISSYFARYTLARRNGF
jgi:hypothetical protein